MTSDYLFFSTKMRRLSQALMVSGFINIGVLSLLTYWIVRESPPTPYCESKPATKAQQISLVDSRTCGEAITQLHRLSYDQLVSKLSCVQLIENGYTERDLALSCLVAFHDFDLERALTSHHPVRQQRLLMWKDKLTGESIPLTIYPGLTDSQFESIITFTKTEQWPLTSKGLFLKLQKQKGDLDPSLVEAFMLTPEFLAVELLFKRSEVPVRKQELVEMLLEGNWLSLGQFLDQQHQLQDLSSARRQKFLLDYIKKGSSTAAYLLVKSDRDFAVKKLDDTQVIAVLQLLSHKTIESERFALEMLVSPRSTSVWQQASLRLYEYAGEPIPENWNYKTSLQRFAPDKLAVENTLQPSNSQVIKTTSVEVASTKPKANEIQSNESKLVASKEAPTSKSNHPPLKENNVKKSETITAAKKSSSYRLYIVQEGDSLWKISRRFAVDMEVLKQINQLESTSIKPGTVLKIP